MFHHFHGILHPKTQGSINSIQFEEIINYVSREYNILGAQEYIKKISNNTILKKDICLSFDDALLSQYDIALPVLKKKNIKAFFFIYSAPIAGEKSYLEPFRYFRNIAFSNINEFYDIFFNKTSKLKSKKYQIEKKKFKEEKYLTDFPFYSFKDKWFRYLRDQFLSPDEYENIMIKIIEQKGYILNDIIKKLWMSEIELMNLKKLGHTLGLHSYNHPTTMHKLNEKSQHKEFSMNLKHLESILGKGTIESMSHPCGNYNQTTLSVLNNLGIKVGFLSNMSNHKVKSWLEIPREDHSNILIKMKNENYNI
tara:strand:+ start:57 stop:983 length:927 start_codon:yes stop_codon:yes gene_type:complete